MERTDSPDAQRDRAVERRTGQDFDAPPGNDPDLGEIAKLAGVAVADALDAHARADLHVVERESVALAERAVARRNRRAVRIGRRLADRRGHAIDQLVRRGVLESLGLLVNAVPRIAKAVVRYASMTRCRRIVRSAARRPAR